MKFPKLLYIGDVPVESTMAGAALLYRLLMTWPADRLRIVTTNFFPASPPQQLPNVEYRKIQIPLSRLLSTRFASWWTGRLFRSAQKGTRAVLSTAGAAEFKPDAILTVAHGFAWITAINVAKHLRIPLHLIVHDDAVFFSQTSAAVAPQVARVFGEVYRSASSRLCVSPYMAEEYQKRYGVSGDVLYPSRAAGINGFDAPPARLAETNRPLTYGYAGSLTSSSYIRSLATLSAIAKQTGDRLLIFSNLGPTGTHANSLADSHVEMHPIIPFRQLIDILRNRVDILFVPMSFDPAEQVIAQLSFPSKLADYTTAGLPLLMQGPASSSALRWATENSGAAAVVDNDSSASLQAMMAKLADPARRIELAQNAIRLGRQYFSHEAALEKFTSIVSQAQGVKPPG